MDLIGEGRTLVVNLSNWGDAIFYWALALVLLIVPALTGGDIWDYSTTLFVIVAVVILLGGLTLRRARLTFDRASRTLTIRQWSLFLPHETAHDMNDIARVTFEERSVRTRKGRRSVGLLKVMGRDEAPLFEFRTFTLQAAESQSWKINQWLGRDP